MIETAKTKNLIEAMFEAGAHFGFTRSRRHPSAKPFLWGTKNRIEIFNLELTSKSLEKAKEFVRNLAKEGGKILFVGGKKEAQEIIRSAAETLGMPYVAGRWIGGTLTNFSQIRKQVTNYENLISERDSGGFEKYTKMERLLLDRKIEAMESKFSGLVLMEQIPSTLFVIDPKREHIAVQEAKSVGASVVGLCGSDCNLSQVDVGIPGNDAAIASISFFVEQIVSSFKEGLKVEVEEVENN
ncbi:MAG: 30S ribosomal protein S2 [Candidatus Pacebacteria bacterium]|nr:30S ribosomal protein S2 [Candidatus Paceibacterota bacterium]